MEFKKYQHIERFGTTEVEGIEIQSGTRTTKYCTGCEKDLILGEFSKDQSKKDGLHSRCEGCKVRYQKEYYKDNRGERIQRNKAYQKTEKGRRATYRANRKYKTTFGGRLQSVFSGMNHRCNNPNDKRYRRYGGRGIKNKFTLDDFRDYVVNVLGITTIGQIESKHVHRIDNDGHYEPGNIEFLTLEEHREIHVKLRGVKC